MTPASKWNCTYAGADADIAPLYWAWLLEEADLSLAASAAWGWPAAAVLATTLLELLCRAASFEEANGICGPCRLLLLLLLLLQYAENLCMNE